MILKGKSKRDTSFLQLEQLLKAAIDFEINAEKISEK